MRPEMLDSQKFQEFKKDIPEIIMLTYGGSYAYGTNIPESDIDIRGICANTEEEILGIKPVKEQYILQEGEMDVTIYSLKKMMSLLLNCNPNIIEILGTKDYFDQTSVGLEMIGNADVFLSKKAAATFSGYAISQLNRLVNKSGKASDRILENEARSINKCFMNENSFGEAEGNLQAMSKDEKILVDLELKGASIDEVINVLNRVNSVHRDYIRSTRNDKAIAHNKLAKHSMHLIRLYMMGIDILEKHEINTYRTGADHDLLMDIRSGKYLEDDMKTPTAEFIQMIDDYQKKFKEAEKNSTLPSEPDYEKANQLMIKWQKELLKL